MRFVVERTLEGEGAALKEYYLGLEVFRRNESYDPRIDPIVRVQARRLRAKLESYYEDEGKGDEILIELPKGAYVPVFRARSPQAEQAGLDGMGGEATPPARATESSRPASSLAVLPFVNMTSDVETGHLGSGLTEELIHALAGVEELRVTSRTSASAVRPGEQDIREIGEKLNVRMVLEGSIRKSGERLRITARLIDVTRDVQLWSQAYDRESNDAFVIQSEIAQAVVHVLKLKLKPKERRSLVRQRTSNLKALSLYVKAQSFWAKRSEGGLQEGIASLENAVQDDPAFAAAYALMAQLYGFLELYSDRRPGEFMPAAKAAALKAIEIDDSFADGHTALGVVSFLYEWDWNLAEQEFQRALSLGPNYPTAHQWYGQFLTAVGRHDEALVEMKLGRDLDPLSAHANTGIGAALYFARRYDEAVEQLEKTAILDPSFDLGRLYLGRSYLAIGAYERAIKELREADSLSGPAGMVGLELGHALAKAGDEAESNRWEGGVRKRGKKRGLPPYALALWHAALGRPTEAVEWLEKAFEERSYWVHLIGVDPLLDGLRSDPGFAALQAKLSLPAS
ncbi:MAG: tetratricopeptide repeat protein [Acidobacteria bacterium]|nr:tetratricopeptide repeat protein [Acidobacteriota bacterium]